MPKKIRESLPDLHIKSRRFSCRKLLNFAGFGMVKPTSFGMVKPQQKLDGFSCQEAVEFQRSPQKSCGSERFSDDPGLVFQAIFRKHLQNFYRICFIGLMINVVRGDDLNQWRHWWWFLLQSLLIIVIVELKETYDTGSWSCPWLWYPWSYNFRCAVQRYRRNIFGSWRLSINSFWTVKTAHTFPDSINESACLEKNMGKPWETTWNHTFF